MERLIFVALILVLVLITVPDGSRNNVASFAFVISIEFLLLLYVAFCFGKKSCQDSLREFWGIWIYLGIWIAICMIQSFEWLGYETWDKYASIRELHLNMGYVGFLFLMVCVLNSVNRIQIVVGVVVCIAIGQTLFGLANYYSGELPFGWRPTHYAAIRVTGTFINRNFFANYLLMCTGFVLIPLVVRSINGKFLGRLPSEQRPTEATLNNGAIDLSCLLISVLLLSGVLLSGSRGAVISLSFAAICILVMVSTVKTIRIKIGRVIVVIGLGTVLFGVDLIKSRFSVVFADSIAKIEQWKATLELIAMKWFAGYGPGSYEVAYKSRIPFNASPLTHNHAHSDYLEMLVEQGAVGGLPLIIFAGIVLSIGVSKAINTRSHFRIRILLSCLFGILAMLCQAAYDFPFQVPSNTILFLLLVAILLATTRLPLRSKKNTGRITS